MNVFFVHRVPELAASYLHDRHVVKMVLETAQIMSAVYARYGHTTQYRPTHQNHPSVRWAGDTVSQYQWLVKHGMGLCREYTHRYGKVHASQRIIESLAVTPEGMYTAGWQDPPQCMPEEFQQCDTVAAYQQYYLGRKVDGNYWTRRPVPSFINQQEIIMAKAKTTAAKTAAAPEADTSTPGTEASVPETAAAPAEDKTPIAKLRGPRGVPEAAIITLVQPANPKRPSSNAFAAYACYTNGMTVGAFCDAVDSLVVDGKSQKGMGTPHLVYDSKRGFITIEGYTVPGGVEPVKPKAVKEPKPAKEPKAKKVTAEKVASPAAEEVAANTAAVKAAVQEETIE